MGRGKKVTIGYKYYLDMHMGVARGPLDEIVHIEADKKTVWAGSSTGNTSIRIDEPKLFGGDKKEGGINGTLDVLMGGPDQSPTPGLVGLLRDNVPGFRGVCTLFYSGQISAMNWNIKPWKIRVRRSTKGWDGPCWNEGHARILMDGGKIHAMNPAHIIYECLTNRDWGGGMDRSRLDDVSFRAAAQTLFAEGFGLCLRWTRQDSVAAFIQGVLDHIAGNLYLSRFDGLIHLSLLRGGYDPAALPLFTPDTGLLGLDADDSSSSSGAVNEVIIKWYDQLSNEARQCRERSIAAIQSNGAITSATIDFPGIPTADLAGRVAVRELAQRAAGLKRFKVRLDRRAYRIEPGGLFRLSDPRRGISNIVLRAGRVEVGSLTDATITISAVQDVYGLPAAALSEPQSSFWTPADTTPRPVEVRRLMETSWRDLAQDLGPGDLDALDPGATYISALGIKPSSTALSYLLFTRVGGNAFAERDSDAFCPAGTIRAALGKYDTTVDVLGVTDLDLVEVGTTALIDDEIVRIDAINFDTARLTIGRGCIDTVPAAHNAGARIWFFDNNSAWDPSAYGPGVAVQARMLTQTSQGTLPESAAPVDTLVTRLRQGRPYPPGRIRIGGEREPVSAAGALTVSWAHRDRKLQADRVIDAEAAGIGPEPGTTYSLRLVRMDNNAQLAIVTGVTGATAQIGPAGYTGPVALEVWAVRDGMESWQRARVEFGYSPV